MVDNKTVGVEIWDVIKKHWDTSSHLEIIASLELMKMHLITALNTAKGEN